jgi:integrase
VIDTRDAGAASDIQKAAEAFLLQAVHLGDTGRDKFAASIGLGRQAIRRVFPERRWVILQESWLIARLRQAMDEVYRSARIRDDFSIQKIRERVGLDYSTFHRVAGDEWRERAATLPTGREKILAALDEMVAANTSVEQLTVRAIIKKAGVEPGYGTWLSEPLRAARLNLAKQQGVLAPESPIKLYPGGYTDLDSNEWRLEPGQGYLRRDKIRPDVAGIAWPRLCEELRASDVAPGTVRRHYREFINAGELLGSEVPDIRAVKLEAVQRAWLAYEGSRSKRAGARHALIQLLLSLTEEAKRTSPSYAKELLGIAYWLRVTVKVPADRNDKDFLMKEELNSLIFCCLTDIKDGIDFTSGNPDLLRMSTRPDFPNGASAVTRWTTALMVLVMALTGLRLRSVLRLKVNDWMQLRSELTVIAWEHSKKREEGIVITPALIIRLLELYVSRTARVREALGTNRVFLTGDVKGDWTIFTRRDSLSKRLSNFVKSHNLTRGGVPIALTTTMLRRTYATHELYKGRSPTFIMAQLGHKYAVTTSKYMQFDRFEHPAQVRTPLDDYGTRVLNLWNTPIVLEGPDSAELVAMFRGDYAADGGGPSTNQAQGTPSRLPDTLPCSTCEKLVSGSDFSDEWESERARREQEIQLLKGDPESPPLPSHLRDGHVVFMTNYARIKGESAGE